MSGVVDPAGVVELSMATGEPPENPFVGPVPLDFGQSLHGRTRETEELSNLLVGKRIVLLFSSSGAGKTPLIRAGLLTRLQRYDIQALPIVRLGHLDPEFRRDATINRYRLAMLSALEAMRSEADRRSPLELSGTTLQEYFEECVFGSMERDAEGRPKYPLLIIDQFEELFFDPLDVDRKREFVLELGALLRGDGFAKREGGESAIWALFSIREDRVAELQPYLDYFPTSLAFRYRLDPLCVEASREVIWETANTTQSRNAWIDSEVPEVIVNDLSTVSVLGEDGQERLQPGPTLEPVQLQIVCRGLWDKVVKAQGRAITVADVSSHSHSEVDRALANFYNEEVAKALTDTDVSERALREWIQTELIAPSGVRTQCLYEPAMFSEDNCVVRRLVDSHVLRLERRSGRDWVELPHDRLVGPIREANAIWSAGHLKPFQLRAKQWHTETGEYKRLLLLRESELDEVNAYALKYPKRVTEEEREFVEASKAEVVSARKVRRWRRRSVGALIGSGLCVVGLALAWGINERSDRNKERVDRQLAELRSEVYRRISGARDQSSTGAALNSLLNLRRDVAEAPGGKPLLPSLDNAIRQQLTRTPAALLRELQPRKHVVWSMAFSSDGDRLFAGSWDGHISLQDLTQPRDAPFVTPDLQSLTYSVVVNDATGLLASTHSDGRVLLWKSHGKQLERIAVLVPPRSNPKRLPTASISQDGRWLAVGGWDKRIDVWDLADPRSARNVASFRNGTTIVQALVFLPGQDATGHHRLATTDYDGDIRIWRIGESMPSKPKPVGTFAIRDHLGASVGISAAAVSPTGRWFVAGDTDGSVHLWDLTSRDADGKGIRLDKATHRGGAQDTHVKGIAFEPDSSGFVSVGLDGFLIRWTFPNQFQNLRELGTSTSAQRFKFPERLFSVAVRPQNSGQVAIGGTRSIYLLDLDRGPGPALSSPLPASVGSRSWRAVSVDAAGTRIVAQDAVGPLRIWQHNAGKLRERTEWTLSGVGISNFMLLPDGQRLITVDCRGTPTEWSLDDGSPLQRVTPDEGLPTRCDKRPGAVLAISPDGRWLATSDTHLLRLYSRRDGQSWSVIANRMLFRPDSDDSQTRVGDLITAMAFSADSTRLAVGTTSGATHLWDVTQAAGRGDFAPVVSVDNGMATRALAFHPDGKSLRAAGSDGFITEYEVPTFKRGEVISRHERAISGLQYAAVTPGEAKWVSADVDGYLVEWMRRTSASDPSQVRTSPGELARRGSRPVQAIALSRDGGFMVTAGADLLAWNLANPDVLKIAQSYALRGYLEPEQEPSR